MTSFMGFQQGVQGCTETVTGLVHVSGKVAQQIRMYFFTDSALQDPSVGFASGLQKACHVGFAYDFRGVRYSGFVSLIGSPQAQQ